MTARLFVAGAVLASAFASCRTITIDPEAPAAERPVAPPKLAFDVRYAPDQHLVLPQSGQPVVHVDGENLAKVTAELRAAFEATGSFASVERAPPGNGLHCELRMREGFNLGMQGWNVLLTAALVPDWHESAVAIDARVTAPGRGSRTYSLESRGVTCVWLPLLPIGLVQAALQPDTRQQAVDALVAQLAVDGWLDGATSR